MLRLCQRNLLHKIVCCCYAEVFCLHFWKDLEDRAPDLSSSHPRGNCSFDLEGQCCSVQFGCWVWRATDLWWELHNAFSPTLRIESPIPAFQHFPWHQYHSFPSPDVDPASNEWFDGLPSEQKSWLWQRLMLKSIWHELAWPNLTRNINWHRLSTSMTPRYAFACVSLIALKHVELEHQDVPWESLQIRMFLLCPYSKALIVVPKVPQFLLVNGLGVAFRVCWAEFGRDEYALNVLDVGCPSFVDLELSHLSI